MDEKSTFSEQAAAGDDGPTLFVQECSCGEPGCNATVFAIHRPQMRDLAGELVPVAYLPPEHLQSLGNFLLRRYRAWKKKAGR